MSEALQRRRQLQEMRLKHRLAIQTRQIERVLAHESVSGQVAGGRVDVEGIRYDVQAQLTQGWERLRDLTSELKVALGVPDVALSRENGRLQISISRTAEPPVSLLDLLALTPDVPPVTAVLGLSDNGRPVLLRFDDSQMSHVLLSGASGAGKSALLRTMALSLALHNRQSQAQLLIIDPHLEAEPGGHRYLEPLNYLPHLLTPVCHSLEEAAEALQFLVAEMERRDEDDVERPSLFAFIDKAASLLEAGGEPVVGAITRLLQRGQQTGIHLILSTQRPGTAVFSASLQANLTVRLAGRLDTPRAARAATGHPASGAEQLRGMGDFVAVIGEARTYFQAAYAGDYDLHLCLQQLHRPPEKVLLARPYFARPNIEPLKDGESPLNGRQMLFFDRNGKLFHDSNRSGIQET